ncbi:MAG: hypothetical protein ACRCVX_12590 [Shewanella sp.]
MTKSIEALAREIADSVWLDSLEKAALRLRITKLANDAKEVRAKLGREQAAEVAENYSAHCLTSDGVCAADAIEEAIRSLS